MPRRVVTPFTEMFGVDVPVVCAPMFLISYPDLIVAASEAGALAAFPAMNFRSHAEFVAAVDDIQSRTKRTFGVNLVLKGNDRLAEDLKLILDREIGLIITSLGDPSEIIRATRGTKTKVFSDVINARHAEKVCAVGVDGLIAVAAGAGGHAGRISPLVLGPWLKKKFKLPVLAAGGISDGRGLAAVLSLGLDAAYMGTRFIATKESPAKPEYKAAIVASNPEDIEYTDRVSGIMGNYIRDSIPAEIEQHGKAVGRWKEIFSAGQGVGLIEDIPTCAELVARIVAEYEQARQNLPAVT